LLCRSLPSLFSLPSLTQRHESEYCVHEYDVKALNFNNSLKDLFVFERKDFHFSTFAFLFELIFHVFTYKKRSVFTVSPFLRDCQNDYLIKDTFRNEKTHSFRAFMAGCFVCIKIRKNFRLLLFHF
jgi:hypothetical protein